jgi:hypothetical protein
VGSEFFVYFKLRKVNFFINETGTNDLEFSLMLNVQLSYNLNLFLLHN